VTRPTDQPLPDDIEALKALIVAQRAALRLAEARAAPYLGAGSRRLRRQ